MSNQNEKYAVITSQKTYTFSTSAIEEIERSYLKQNINIKYEIRETKNQRSYTLQEQFQYKIKDHEKTTFYQVGDFFDSLDEAEFAYIHGEYVVKGIKKSQYSWVIIKNTEKKKNT